MNEKLKALSADVEILNNLATAEMNVILLEDMLRKNPNAKNAANLLEIKNSIQEKISGFADANGVVNLQNRLY